MISERNEQVAAFESTTGLHKDISIIILGYLYSNRAACVAPEAHVTFLGTAPFFALCHSMLKERTGLTKLPTNKVASYNMLLEHHLAEQSLFSRADRPLALAILSRDQDRLKETAEANPNRVAHLFRGETAHYLNSSLRACMSQATMDILYQALHAEEQTVLMAVIFNQGKAISEYKENTELEAIGDYNEHSALQVAAKLGHLEAASALLDQKADLLNKRELHIDGFTPLHFAVMHQHPSLVALLIKKGSKPEMKSRAAKTAFELAEDIDKGEEKSAAREGILKALGQKVLTTPPPQRQPDCITVNAEGMSDQKGITPHYPAPTRGLGLGEDVATIRAPEAPPSEAKAPAPEASPSEAKAPAPEVKALAPVVRQNDRRGHCVAITLCTMLGALAGGLAGAVLSTLVCPIIIGAIIGASLGLLLSRECFFKTPAVREVGYGPGAPFAGPRPYGAN